MDTKHTKHTKDTKAKFELRAGPTLCVLCILGVLRAGFDFAPPVHAQRGAPQGPPPPARAAAPIDLTGYWVSLVTDDWRWRMVAAPRGDVLYLPVNAEGRRAANEWDPAKDEAAGEQAHRQATGDLMPRPGGRHIPSQAVRTLSLKA